MSKGKSTGKKSQKQSTTLSPHAEQRPESPPPPTGTPAEPSSISGKTKSERSGQPIQAGPPEPLYDVIIDVNIFYYAGRQEAKKEVLQLISEILLDEKNKESWGFRQGKLENRKGG